MHQNVIQYIEDMKVKHPEFFLAGLRVLDVGSMDINGNNKQHFPYSEYTGMDIGEGPNVDIVSPVHEWTDYGRYDVVVSTEMLEHDQYFRQSIHNMVKLLKPGGLLLVTCAGAGRAEHGTKRTSPADSPYTTDYYYNVGLRDVQMFDWEEKFSEYGISYYKNDFRFYGIKR